jgi:hypothetical protein
MRRRQLSSVLLGVMLTVTCAASVLAQPVASSLADLKTLANAKKATVTDAKGYDFRGTITDASDSLLTLRIGSETRQFAVSEIRLVRVQRGDSPLNGALIGAAIAGGLTSLIFLDNECRDDPACYKTLAAYAGVGALAGLGIDALIHRTVVVYTARSRGAAGPFAVTPLITPERKGMRLIVMF